MQGFKKYAYKAPGTWFEARNYISEPGPQGPFTFETPCPFPLISHEIKCSACCEPRH
jgi:hypothetical protein